MTHFAVADSNGGEGMIVLTSTIAATPFGAVNKALLTDERGANIYSGASLASIPPIPGNWADMQSFGYQLVEIEICIMRQVPT